MSEDSTEESELSLRELALRRTLAKHPKPGAKVRYRGVTRFWISYVEEAARRELKVGEVYTLKSIRVNSSWVSVTLEETGDTRFSVSFFEEVPSAGAQT